VLLAQTNTVPPLINYQGNLTDEQGNGLIGLKKLEFNIYDAPAAGNKLWGPQVFDNVPLIDGKFNVILGSSDAGGRLVTDAFSEGNRFLGIKVTDAGGDLTSISEVTPRQQILSNPYAIKAADAQELGGKLPAWYMPTGTIVAYWGISAPEGWLLCNGDAVPLGTEYDSLRALVGDSLPDLRGVFLRGIDNGKGFDPDGGSRNIGSYQSDTANGIESITTSGANNVGTTTITVPKTASISNWARTGMTGDGIYSIAVRGNGNETRSKNIAVNYIIKY